MKTDVLVHLAHAQKAAVTLLQETHVKESCHLKIPGYIPAAFIISDVHGTAAFVNNHNTWRMKATCPEGSGVEWTAINVERITIVNVYTPPRTQWSQGSIPGFKRPCIYARDFNCHSTTWGYPSTNSEGISLEHWASAEDLTLLFDPKQLHTFHSARWNTTSNPDLVFTKLKGALPQRLILDPFPKTHHRPSLITPVNPTEPVKRWNFRKANW